jgi:hypothetical protein
LEKKEKQARKHACKTLTFKIEINEKSGDGARTSNDTLSKMAKNNFVKTPKAALCQKSVLKA